MHRATTARRARLDAQTGDEHKGRTAVEACGRAVERQGSAAVLTAGRLFLAHRASVALPRVRDHDSLVTQGQRRNVFVADGQIVTVVPITGCKSQWGKPKTNGAPAFVLGVQTGEVGTYVRHGPACIVM